jgi:hypothetical protein
MRKKKLSLYYLFLLFLGDNFMDIKIQKILEACKNGMPKKQIDPKGNGSSVRGLEKKDKVTQAKIDQMYANVLAYQKNIAPLTTFKLKIDPNARLTNEQKCQLLKDAVVHGVSASQIEKNSHGVMKRLLADQSIRETTVDRLYANLLAFFGYNIPANNCDNKLQSAPDRIRALEVHTLNFIEQIEDLKAEVEHLKKLLEKPSQTSASCKRPRKICGLTVTLRSSKSNGKTYKRWYAITKKDSKRKMIYIGKTLANAEKKIRQGLTRLGVTNDLP